MSKFFLFFLLILFQFTTLQAQDTINKNNEEDLWAFQTFEKTHLLYQLENKIRRGETTALYEIATYLDIKKIIVEYLGYHVLEPKENEVARRIIDENSLFLASELVLDSTLTKQKWLDFLENNKTILTFDQLTNCFLITPISQRKAGYKLKRWRKDANTSLPSFQKLYLSEMWVSRDSIAHYFNIKNPLCLLKLASSFFKSRDRFNEYNFDELLFIQLMQQLTGLEIAVNNSKGELSFISYKEYGDATKLNYLIYWTQHYKNYTWNEKQKIFTTSHAEIEEINYIENLFKQLSLDNDSLVFLAWEKLAISDTLEVNKIATEYKKADIKHNYCIGYQPYDYIKMLTRLSDYCRNNHIIFQPNKQLLNNLLHLKQSNIPFRERYELENSLVKSLTFQDITALEYWTFLYHKDDTGTFQPSISRIIDIFYQLHWKELQQDEKQLKLYLKKAYLFENLRTESAFCGRYLRRLKNLTTDNLNFLQKIEQSNRDYDIAIQLKLLKNYHPEPLNKSIPEYSDFYPNDTIITNVKKEFHKILKPYNERYNIEREMSIRNFLSKLSYAQIGEALNLIDTIRYNYESRKYCFLEHNFGLPIEAYSDNLKADLLIFKSLYSQKTEFEVYKYYIEQLGYNVFLADGKLDYNMIYNILTFDIVSDFTSWSYREDGIYAIIRLLEITYETRLHFPHKAGNSSGFSGGIENRALAWRNYLKEQKLVVFMPEEEPFSMND
jgi:hypothetical protein